MTKKYFKIKKEGFTLIEVLVTVAIFASIFSIISGLFLSALKIQKRALASQDLIKESSYVMEYMGRQLRMAQKSEGDCAEGDKNYEIGSNPIGVKFKNYNDECWTFLLELDPESGINRLKVKKGLTGGEYFLTSQNLEITDFKIALSGDGDEAGVNRQPKVTLLLKIKGRGERIENMPEIAVQTTISQRNLDI